MRVKLWHAGLIVAAMAAATPSLADVKAGVDAWSKGEYRRAVDEWRGPAVKGDADAQFNLGQAYKLGRGVPADLPVAEGWYRKAAAQGHIQAEDNYGLALFQNGKRTEALPWLEKSAARGEPRAQYVLGTMLFNGDGASKDWVRAYAMTLRASQAGLPQAGQSLAQMDRYIPAADRQRGAELARTMEADAGRPNLPSEELARATPPSPPAPQRPGREPIRSADLPPSAAQPGTSYSMPGRVPPGRVPPPPAREPRPTPVMMADRPVAGAGWRVQLGAFRDRGNAEALWQRLRGRVTALRSLQPIMVSAGTVTKLQAGPLGSSAQAASTCRQVKAAGTECLTVAP